MPFMLDNAAEASPEADADAARQLARAVALHRAGAVASWNATLERLGLPTDADEAVMGAFEDAVQMDSVKRKRRKKMKKHKYALSLPITRICTDQLHDLRLKKRRRVCYQCLLVGKPCSHLSLYSYCACRRRGCRSNRVASQVFALYHLPCYLALSHFTYLTKPLECNHCSNPARNSEVRTATDTFVVLTQRKMAAFYNTEGRSAERCTWSYQTQTG